MIISQEVEKMSYIYIAYNALEKDGNPIPQGQSIGAGSSLERLLKDGIFLHTREAYIFLCKVVKDETKKPKVKHEVFVGSFSPITQAFKSAELILDQ